MTAILAVLSGATYIGIQRSQVRVMNEKVIDDLTAIENALNQFIQDNGRYPMPSFAEPRLEDNKNVLCFGEDLMYVHDCNAALFMQTQVDNDLLTKRYLQEVPTDPRTHSRYMYGVTRDGKYFQVAGNFEEDDGSWTARTSGNVNDYPFLTSLIRSYSGPDFVVDGEGWLPYSPDHLAISAGLADITGSITVDDKPASEGDSVKPGSTIKAAPGSSVTLYFSDGSITYLDGTDDPAGATLRLLPDSEVEKNDKDGIITKIRLKLTSGKIWNKVVRLASQSQFNVETTSAIAGVRGTEFGINSDASEFIVYSGSVYARELSPSEIDLATGTEAYLEFDETDFAVTQLAAGDGLSFKTFDVPASSGTMPAGTSVIPQTEQEIKEKYYSHTLGLSPANTPYIKEAQSHNNGTYTLYITFNGFESDGTLQIDGFELFGGSQIQGLRGLKEDEHKNPLLVVDNIAYSATDKAYLFDIDYKTQPGNPFYDQYKGEMESIVLRAFRMVNGKPVYSRLSWPLIGLTPDLVQSLTYEFNNGNVYQEFFGVAESQSPAVCGNNVQEGFEQCDDGSLFAFDKCDDMCKLTKIVLYADYGGSSPSYVPDYADGPVSADPIGGVTTTTAGLKLDANTQGQLKHTNFTWPNLQKGSMEFVVNGADLKANAGTTLYLFDMQETSNPNVLDKRVRLLRRTSNNLQFDLREIAGITLLAKTSASDLVNLPNGELKIQITWNVNAANDPDKAILKIYDGGNPILTNPNVVAGTIPNLGANTATSYHFFVGSETGGQNSTQFPGIIKSFMIKSE